jgi:NAD(P)-dependent dehydrogenase (short-subunit alcohol dehydrogenase family)
MSVRRLVDRTDPLADGLTQTTALIVGVGENLGFDLARTFANAGMNVVLARRRISLLEPLADELAQAGTKVLGVRCDATDEASVKSLFDTTISAFGVPDLVVFNIENFSPGTILDIDVAAFEDCWRSNCFAGFLIARQAAQMMVGAKKGTILFSGATASLRGKHGYINLAVGKSGLRALAQSMARELGPSGVHVAHVVLDGSINSMGPQYVAETYLNLHRQPKTAWTHELDLRTYDEAW